MKDIGIVVLHGFLMKKIVMSPLCKRLKPITPYIHNYEYNTRRIKINDIRKDLLEISKEYRQVFLIGHSLGGIIIREAIASNEFTNVLGVFTLGTPHQGSELAKFTKNISGGFILGDAAGIGLIDSTEKKWVNKIKLHCISGNKPIGLIRLIPKSINVEGFLLSDGTVTLTESQLPNATTTIIFPHTHTSLIYSKQVAIYIKCIIYKTLGESEK
jgi:hypothetical protein